MTFYFSSVEARVFDVSGGNPRRSKAAMLLKGRLQAAFSRSSPLPLTSQTQERNAGLRSDYIAQVLHNMRLFLFLRESPNCFEGRLAALMRFSSSPPGYGKTTTVRARPSVSFAVLPRLPGLTKNARGRKAKKQFWANQETKNPASLSEDRVIFNYMFFQS